MPAVDAVDRNLGAGGPDLGEERFEVAHVVLRRAHPRSLSVHVLSGPVTEGDDEEGRGAAGVGAEVVVDRLPEVARQPEMNQRQ